MEIFRNEAGGVNAAKLSAMESRGEFRLKLTEVASELDVGKLNRLKYLCSDTIPAGDLEKVKTPEQLFLELEHRKKIEPNRLKFLIDCLDGVGRKDLAADLKSYERKRTEGEHFLPHFTNDVRVLVQLNAYSGGHYLNCLLDKISLFLARVFSREIHLLQKNP